ncbi:MAG TPA: chorismate mutase [Thermoanaerobaculia bacterium]|nr:chorismate mutase [Thermoanaerobaculia bacterium]
MSSPDSLSNLRDSIADVDRALMELLRRRMDLAADVGRIKAESNLPVVVRDVEDQVLSRARQHAEACGVSEEVMESVFQAIMRGSVERQYRMGIELREQRGERVLIVGGAGGMGQWFRGFLELAGHSVDLADPALGNLPHAPGRFASLDEAADLDAYAAILVAVPLGRTAPVLEEVVERGPKGMVVEIASIKDPLSPVLARSRERGVRSFALHPMFGPGKSYYEPLTFVLAAQGEPTAEKRELAPLLAHPYTKLVAVPFAHHDRLMGWLLGLAHLTSILFGAAITRSGVEPAELHACASTTFTRQATTALNVLSENPDLYLDIQNLNPHRHEVYAATREALAQIEKLVEEREREGFRETLSTARRALTREP